MIKGIMAGIMVAFAATLNLKIGGIVGAILFSLGLLTILTYQFNLFTGKAGLLATKQISLLGLFAIYWQNLIGTAIWVCVLLPTKLYEELQPAVNAINDIRFNNGPLTNFVMGLICGVLMYLAVEFYKSKNYSQLIMCVAGFILFGANHCVADMFYYYMAPNFGLAWPLLFTTLGNIVGCNLIPYTTKKAVN